MCQGKVKKKRTISTIYDIYKSRVRMISCAHDIPLTTLRQQVSAVSRRREFFMWKSSCGNQYTSKYIHKHTHRSLFLIWYLVQQYFYGFVTLVFYSSVPFFPSILLLCSVKFHDFLRFFLPFVFSVFGCLFFFSLFVFCSPSGIKGFWWSYPNIYDLVERELKIENPFTDWTRSSFFSPDGLQARGHVLMKTAWTKHCGSMHFLGV